MAWCFLYNFLYLCDHYGWSIGRLWQQAFGGYNMFGITGIPLRAGFFMTTNADFTMSIDWYFGASVL